jgi:type I restriction enzyme S subunit
MSSRLRDLAEVHYGKSPNEVISEDSTVPIIGTGGIYGRASRSLFKGPAVVVARKGTLGNPRFVDEPFWPVDTTYAVLAKPGVDTKWLYYSLAAFDLTKLNEATGVPSISRDWLYKVPLGSTDFVAQRRIAEILSTLDEAIEQTEALIAKHQQIKAGLMHDLFTRGVTPDGHLRPTHEQAPDLYKESPLGWIPKEWDTKQIHQLGKVKGGKRVPAGTPFASAPTPYPYLRVTDMVDGWIDDTALEYVDVATELLITNYKIFRDDIYVTIAGTLGQFGRIPEHLSGAQLTENAARITEIDKMMVDLDFLCSVLRSDLLTEQKFASIGIGAGVPKLALYQIERFRIPIPDIDEQMAIQTPLTALQASIKESAIVLEKLRQQKQGLMHDLLTGRVRVNV